MNASTDFAAHLTTVDKNEWLISHGGFRFALTRTEPDDANAYWCVNPRKPSEVIHGWRLCVLADNGTTVLVHETTGMIRNVDPEQGPLAGSCAKRNIEQMHIKLRWYAEGMQRLAVMVDALLAGPAAPTKKAAKLRERALIDLRYHNVVIAQGTIGLVAGDAVLVVNERTGSGWAELTYRIGAEAIYDSYNLSYIGEITSISPKTITVTRCIDESVRRLKHGEFVRYNSRPIAEAKRRNAEWMD